MLASLHGHAGVVRRLLGTSSASKQLQSCDAKGRNLGIFRIFQGWEFGGWAIVGVGVGGVGVLDFSTNGLGHEGN